MNIKKALVLVVLFSTVSTYFFYFTYGSQSQVSELPIILRFEDPGYLEKDFYVSEASEFGPRYCFAKFMAAVSSKKSLPYICFLLTLLINLLTGLATFTFTFDIFDRSLLAGLLAAGLVLSVETFLLGYYPHLYARQLLSSSLAFPFILLAFWAGLRQAPFLWAVSGGIAALLHPTFGIEGALIGFFALVVSGTLKCGANVVSFFKYSGKKTAAAFLLFCLFAVPQMIIYFSISRINSLQYIEIETIFRHPHHNLSGHLKGLFEGICFFFACGFALHFLYKKSDSRKRPLSLAILAVFLLIFVLCGLGLFFVEVFPLRLWALARPFRLLYLLKWLGLILIAGRIACLFSGTTLKNITLKPFVFLVSTLSPPTMVISFAADRMKGKNTKKPPVFHPFLNPWILIAGILCCLFFLWIPALKNVFLLVLFCFLTLFFVFFQKTQLFYAVSGFLVLLLLAPLIRYTPLGDKLPHKVDLFLNVVCPNILYSDVQGELYQVSRFARENTKEDSLFLIPPNLGNFRLMAGRAVVVNWKSFPFQDEAAAAWKERLLRCYGPVNSTGHAARDEMTANFKKIDDKKLEELKKEFGFSFSLLFKETPTDFTVIYANRKYKIIVL
jgi:hypothetical protein